MEVIVPFSTERPKSRLSAVLTPDERAAFARTMLQDVLAAIDAADGEPRILRPARSVSISPPRWKSTTAPDRRGQRGDRRPSRKRRRRARRRHRHGRPRARDAERPAGAVRGRTRGRGRDRPGRGGGTNAFVAGHPAFRVDYHGASYLDHRRIADEIGAGVRVVDSHRLATDVDEPADLAELLIHPRRTATAGGGAVAPRRRLRARHDGRAGRRRQRE